jgi:D-alanyl-D-alanine carboxypeptidase/D-alanyl-D-alanine-endopeptidase (penicillin-binding protein 4)
VAARPVEYLVVESRVLTGPAGSEGRLIFRRDPVEESVLVLGSVPLGGDTLRRSVAVRSPGEFYLRALRQVLESEGIVVAGVSSVVRGFDRARCRVLFTQASPALSEILKPLLKISQNLYAETLVRAIGLDAGEGSFEKGREVLAGILRAMAIEEGTYSYADGSGLSRLNLLSADLLVRLLRFMYRHPRFAHFYEALPIAGVDGTIENRMKGSRAENNVRAKTGTLAYVRALSGYVRTDDGEMLAFAMLANNFLVSSSAAEYVQDLALERLANFRRSP